MSQVVMDTPAARKLEKLSDRKLRLKSGQWFKFELPSDDSLRLVMAKGKQAQIVKVTDPEELKVLIARTQKSADGRLVGIYLAAAHTPLGTVDEHGQPQFAHMPATIAPQRAILGPAGEQNLQTLWDGQAVTVLLLADTLCNVEPLLLREDVPKHRDATCHPDWNPRR